jgi:hypothetical protein
VFACKDLVFDGDLHEPISDQFQFI